MTNPQQLHYADVVFSLHDPIGTDKEVNEIMLIDILGSEADDVVEKVQLKIEKSKIYQNLEILDDREKEVVVGALRARSGRSCTRARAEQILPGTF